MMIDPAHPTTSALCCRVGVVGCGRSTAAILAKAHNWVRVLRDPRTQDEGGVALTEATRRLVGSR